MLERSITQCGAQNCDVRLTRTGASLMQCGRCVTPTPAHDIFCPSLTCRRLLRCKTALYVRLPDFIIDHSLDSTFIPSADLTTRRKRGHHTELHAIPQASDHAPITISMLTPISSPETPRVFVYLVLENMECHVSQLRPRVTEGVLVLDHGEPHSPSPFSFSCSDRRSICTYLDVIISVTFWRYSRSCLPSSWVELHPLPHSHTTQSSTFPIPIPLLTERSCIHLRNINRCTRDFVTRTSSIHDQVTMVATPSTTDRR